MNKVAAFTQVLEDRAALMDANPTESEALLYRRLSDARIEFWTQVVVGFYIVDIILPDRMLIIEIDGLHHKRSENRKKDLKRSKWLRNFGFTVGRISNKKAATLSMSRVRKFPRIGSVGGCKRAIAKASRARDKVVEKDGFVPSEFYLTASALSAIFTVPDLNDIDQELELALFYDRT